MPATLPILRVVHAITSFSAIYCQICVALHSCNTKNLKVPWASEIQHHPPTFQSSEHIVYLVRYVYQTWASPSLFWRFKRQAMYPGINYFPLIEMSSSKELPTIWIFKANWSKQSLHIQITIIAIDKCPHCDILDQLLCTCTSLNQTLISLVITICSVYISQK